MRFENAAAAGGSEAMRYEGPDGYIWVVPETAAAIRKGLQTHFLAIGKRPRNGKFHFQSVKHAVNGDEPHDLNTLLASARDANRGELATHLLSDDSLERHLLGFPKGQLRKWASLSS